jgi:hypothetical protein
VRKQITDIWEDCSSQWKDKLIQVDYKRRVIKLYKTSTEIAEYKMTDKLRAFIDPDSNRVYIYSCVNPLGQSCKIYLSFPPEGVIKNYVTLYIQQPTVPYMYYLKAN